MADQVAYPAGIRTYSCVISALQKGQIVHELPFAGSRNVLNRGYGHFQGVSVFQEAKGDLAAEIEAFFASFVGVQNYTELPIHRRVIPGDIQVTAVNGARYTVSDANGLKVGQYARLAGRLYQLRSVAGSVVTLWPLKPIPVNSTLTPGRTVRACSRRSPVESPLSLDWSGPWSWAWEECID